MPVFCVVLSILWSLWPVIAGEGWPLNHDGLNVRDGILIYHRALESGRLFPFWSAETLYGMGSWQPLFYHKLFYQVAAPFLAFGSMKAAVIITLFLFLGVGSWGVYSCGRRLGGSPTVAMVVAAIFPCLNYLVTEWLVRGAFSEFAAAALLPWWLNGLITAVEDRRVPPYLYWVGVLLFLAHSLICFVALVLSVPVLVRFSRASWRHGIVPASILLGLAITQFSLRREVRLEALEIYSPRGYFVDLLGRYLALYPDPWGRHWGELPLRVDLFPALTVVVGFLWLYRTRKREKDSAPGTVSSRRLLGYLAIATLFLMTSPSGFIYLLPGFRLIQFPYRLLAFFQVFVLMGVAIQLTALERLRGSRVAGSVALLVMALTLLDCKSWRTRQYGSYTPQELEARPKTEEFVGPMGVLEFAPRVRTESDSFRLLYGQFQAWSRAPALLDEKSCRLDSGQRTGHERRYRYDCDRGTVGVFPVSYTSWHRVYFDAGVPAADGNQNENPAPRGTRLALNAFRTDTDPRLRVELPRGTGLVILKDPVH